MQCGNVGLYITGEVEGSKIGQGLPFSGFKLVGSQNAVG